MEQQKVDYDSDIIVCDIIPETISITSSPEHKKPKKRKQKRRVKKGININSNMETLMITQKMKFKKCKARKTKFKCIININTVCEERGSSIVRSGLNVCKKEAYYQRIVPVCLRKMCSRTANCCRSTISKDYNKYIIPKVGSLSPVSSVGLSEIFSCHNISYEDLSNGNFSSVSEEELDTLIRRSKQREKQIYLHAREHMTSTPMSKVENIPSPFSIEDKKSIHSDNTMILNPLSSEAYSPTFNVIDNLENVDDMINIGVPYSSAIFKIGANERDNDACSPTYTQESAEIEYNDYDRTRNLTHTTINAHDTSMFTPDFIKIENFNNTIMENANIHYGNEIYSPSSPTPDIKMENLNIYQEKTGVNESEKVGYTPKSPTMTPQFKYTDTASSDMNDLNVPYMLTSKMIKQESLDDEPNNTPNSDILTSDLIKTENEKRQEKENNSPAHHRTDYNMNNTMLCKNQRNYYQTDRGEIVVKTERCNNKNDNYVERNKNPVKSS